KKSDSRAHLAQDEGTDLDFEVVLLMTITSNETQPRIPIEEEEEELTAASIFNKASNSTIKVEGELIHPAFIVEAELVEFDKVVTKEKWLKVMKEEINSIKKNQIENWWILLQIRNS
ncbi:hypothetical protein CR513_56444, partial [Mucuna pruriens]